ncbi:hypothetical protein D3C86_1751900 [compost metagenome]
MIAGFVLLRIMGRGAEAVCLGSLFRDHPLIGVLRAAVFVVQRLLHSAVRLIGKGVRNFNRAPGHYPRLEHIRCCFLRMRGEFEDLGR